ncbi:MAG: GAF domain-containing protein [Nitrospirae bacterium]|nr:GAF domain-containing protein [Nitrospirota bacterium]MBI5694269.1 GAF domain-containing protein [Nitrospirota bacterium]
MVTSEKVELEILSEVSKVANSTLEYNVKLEKIVSAIAGRLGRDVCYVVLRDRDRDTLVLKAAVGLNPDSIDRVMLRMGEGVTGWAAEHKEPVALAVARDDPRFRLVRQTGEERYTSLLAVPILYDQRCIGVMAVQTVEPHEYSQDEITLLSTIANDVGGIINSAQLYQDAKTNLEALSALYDVSQALMSTLDLPTLLDRIARSSAEVIGAKGCILRLLNKESGLLEIKASHGFAAELGRKTELRIGESIAGMVAADGKPMLIKDVYEHPEFLNATGAVVRSLLCVPMIAKDKVIGTIALYDKEEEGRHGEQPFNDDDLHLLTTLATQASMAVENAFIFERAEDLAQENEKKAAELSFLYDVAYAMRSTLKLDRLLHTILTAMTIGGGMSFNRAILFLVNERTKTMQGMLGVGPSSAWEAGEIWSRLGDRPVNFREWTLTDTELAAQNESAFNRMAKSLRVSYEEETGVFAAAIRERRAILIEDAEKDPLAGPDILELMGVRSFAAVPLVAKDKVTSLVVVDNKFTGRPITMEGLRFLMMFANQAGLAIEAAMAYSNLERTNRDLKEAQARLIQSEKMAALGEMAASIAHEIKNPLTVIGGFATRLARKAAEGDEARYARIIKDEALRLDKILQEVLDFSRDMKPNLQKSSLRELCEETLDMYAEQLREKGIRVGVELSSEMGDVMLDPQQMKQAVINILANSMQAMEATGGREIRIRAYRDADADRMVLEVEDTGGGIPADMMENIFNPFFTTKEKGTGLGLAITSKIIKNHGGEIEVVNREGVGATFRIKLPPVREEIIDDVESEG